MVQGDLLSCHPLPVARQRQKTKTKTKDKMTKLNVSDNDSYSTDSDCGAIRLTMLRSTSPSCRTITMQDSDSQKQSRLLDWKTDQLQLRQNRQAQPHLNPPLQYSTPFLHSTNDDDCAKESSSKTAHACNLSALQACRQFVKTRLWGGLSSVLVNIFHHLCLENELEHESECENILL